MPNPLSKLNTGKSWKELFGFKLRDPDNVDSDIRPQDLEMPDEPEDEHEEALVDLVMDRFKSASSVKELHQREWLVCQAFRMGNQWVQWRNDELEDLRDPDDPKRAYTTNDQIDRLMKKLKARATQSKPDASVKPLSSNPLDIAAAAEARDLIAHYDAKYNRQEQTLQWVDSVLSTSTTCLKVVWNPSARVLAPTKSGIAKYQVLGEIEEELVPPDELYPNPSARDWPDIDWLIHRYVMTLSRIQSHFGERGMRVKGQKARGTDSAYSWTETRLDAISGEGAPTITSNEETATVYECWEKPSLRYPKGRLLIVADGILLTDPDQVDWPYEKDDDFPFIPLRYEMRSRGLWSLNAVSRLVPIQRQLNVVTSRMQDRMQNDKVIVAVPTGGGFGLDDFSSPSSAYEIRYNQGFEPQIFQPSPLNESHLALANWLIAQMENISGVHEISNGITPPGVEAGNAIELLQNADQTQMAEFITLIEVAQKRRAEWEIALASQFIAEPRLIAVSTLPSQVPQAQTPNQLPPDAAGGMVSAAPPTPTGPTPAMAVRAFEGLTKGGQVHIEVVPGSATPKSPAARLQQYLDLAKYGFFDPQKLPVLKVVADLMGIERSDVFTDRIDQAFAAVQAQQPPPQVLQQMQAEQDQQKLQMQLEAQAQMEAIKVHGMVEVEQIKAQLVSQLQAQKAQAQADAQLNDHHHDAAMHGLEAITPNVSIGFTGKLGTTALPSAERMIGLDADSPAEVEKLNAPPQKPNQDKTGR